MDHFPNEILLLAVLLSIIQNIAANQDLQVNVSTGILEGFRTDSTVNFLGIPYAQPPIRDLRFLPPKEAKKWNGIFQAKEYGPNCMQNIALMFGSSFNIPAKLRRQSEDCLTLNIHVPGIALEHNVTDKSAVMVFIHGGAFLVGGSSVNDGTFLAAKEGVIVVSINYRLDIFGFMTTGGSTIPGNMGLMDQILALKWIQENIGQFGGDKDRVTVFGISAGGVSISLLMHSPKAKGLFSGAICQSGVEYTRTLPENAKLKKLNIIKSLTDKIGCTGNNEDELVRCLQNAPVHKLITTEYPTFSWFNSPIVDGEGGVVPKQPSALWGAQHLSPVRYMAGIVRGDGSAFVEYYLRSSIENIYAEGFNLQMATTLLQNGLRAHYGNVSGNLPFEIDDLIPLVIDNYFEKTEDKVSNIHSMLDFFRDLHVLSPTTLSLKAMSRFYNVECFFYFMTYSKDGDVQTGPTDMEPFHAKDAEFIFGDYLNDQFEYDNLSSHMDMAVSASMMHAWSTFAKYGVQDEISPEEVEIARPVFDNPKRIKIFHIYCPTCMYTTCEKGILVAQQSMMVVKQLCHHHKIGWNNLSKVFEHDLQLEPNVPLPVIITNQ